MQAPEEKHRLRSQARLCSGSLRVPGWGKPLHIHAVRDPGDSIRCETMGYQLLLDFATDRHDPTEPSEKRQTTGQPSSPQTGEIAVGPAARYLRDDREAGSLPYPGCCHGLQIEVVRMQDGMPGPEPSQVAEQAGTVGGREHYPPAASGESTLDQDAVSYLARRRIGTCQREHRHAESRAGKPGA
jgi:hypothetical protein